ncbi:PAS domain-containing protein [Palleronia sp. LCG004]|uniref:PAS domain-containing protein n=1 Tax=Palleronia sp. LCG004 TaxID=3079304 RepID=UPI002942A6F4|nr:PAS domain-containing protein [Palleronia sp. LCG004]WOI57216.1 PAS domain-containing protein [Palleronia sp. LCG004]
MFGSNDDDRIVSLGARRAAQAYDPAFAQLETYWSALAGTRDMPFRDEVDPRGLDGVLDRIFLLERIAPGLARFRIAGQAVTDIMGIEMRGMPLSSAFTPEARDPLNAALRAVFDDPVRLVLGLEGQRQGLRAKPTAQMLFLPLRDRFGQVSRAVGAIASSARPARAPQRFDIVSEDLRKLFGTTSDGHQSAAISDDDAFATADRARANLRSIDERRASLRIVSSIERE